MAIYLPIYFTINISINISFKISINLGNDDNIIGHDGMELEEECENRCSQTRQGFH